MSKSRVLFMILIVAFLLAGFAGPVLAGPVGFKFAHFVPPNEPGAEVGVWIENDLNKKMGDKFKAKFYHSGQMGNAIEIVKKVRMGTLQAGFTTGNYAPELNPKFGIATLAYCMDSYPKWEAFLKNDALREELFTCLTDKGLRVLGLAYFGLYGFTTTKPVKQLEDLKSFKMRTTQARYPLAFWKALGVNPIPMAWGDVFPALKQGVIDGTDQTATVTVIRLADICKYYTHTNHMIGLMPLIVNEKWWQGLDDETRASFLEIINENMAKARQASMELTKSADSKLEKKGVTIINLSDEEVALFKATQKKVWDEFEPEIGKEWLTKVVEFTKSVKE